MVPGGSEAVFSDWIRILWVSVLTISALLGGGWTLHLYWRQRLLERARWQRELFKDIYLNDGYYGARNKLEYVYSTELAPVLQKRLTNRDIDLSDGEVKLLVELDNFLNVFEHTLYLKEQGLVSGRDLNALFYYWFDIMKSPERGLLRRYLIDFGFNRIMKHLKLSKKDPQFIFFYGTLKGLAAWARLGDEDGNPVYNYIDAASVRNARTHGELRVTRVGNNFYPMLGYLSPDHSGTPKHVFGKLYKLLDVSAAFRELDQFERFDPRRDVANNTFIRTCIQVECLDGEKNEVTGVSDAWIYIFNKAKLKDFLEGKLVPSGDWQENDPNGQAGA